MKNVPEPEIPIFRVTFVYRGRTFSIFCNVYDFLDCDATDCALDLFDSYVQKYVEVEKMRRDVVTIENIRGGKIFIYTIDGTTACLCIHRAEINCIDICKNYEK